MRFLVTTLRLVDIYFHEFANVWEIGRRRTDGLYHRLVVSATERIDGSLDILFQVQHQANIASDLAIKLTTNIQGRPAKVYITISEKAVFSYQKVVVSSLTTELIGGNMVNRLNGN